MICLLHLAVTLLLLATTLAARNVRGMKGRMTALPLWRPELSLESCPVEETEDSQAPSNHTTTGGADTKVANLLFPAHYNPPSLPSPYPYLPYLTIRHLLPKSPHHLV